MNGYPGVVLAAAWWYELVASLSVGCADLFATSVGRIFGFKAARKVDDFIRCAVSFLFGQWLAWWIAGGYLRAMWDARLDEENRLFWLRKGGKS
jgi:hypothetical protein